jgi:hypothetical protein
VLSVQLSVAIQLILARGVQQCISKGKAENLLGLLGLIGLLYQL